jgi:hypothetical protein
VAESDSKFWRLAGPVGTNIKYFWPVALRATLIISGAVGGAQMAWLLWAKTELAAGRSIAQIDYSICRWQMINAGVWAAIAFLDKSLSNQQKKKDDETKHFFPGGGKD